MLLLALVLLLSSPKEVTRKGRALRKCGKQSLFCARKKAKQKMLYHILLINSKLSSAYFRKRLYIAVKT